jgi:hypothetical protein
MDQKLPNLERAEQLGRQYSEQPGEQWPGLRRGQRGERFSQRQSERPWEQRAKQPWPQPALQLTYLLSTVCRLLPRRQRTKYSGP